MAKPGYDPFDLYKQTGMGAPLGAKKTMAQQKEEQAARAATPVGIASPAVNVPAAANGSPVASSGAALSSSSRPVTGSSPGASSAGGAQQRAPAASAAAAGRPGGDPFGDLDLLDKPAAMNAVR
jgi:hypothetical protein